MTNDTPTSRLRSRTRWVRIAAALAVAAASLAVLLVWRGESRSDPASANGTLIVGDQRGGAQALLKAAGELDHVPYRIEWALFPAASPLLEALDAGAIDIGGIGGAPFAFAYAGGAKIRAVHAYRQLPGAGRASAIVVRADSPLRTVADLGGKKIATIRGSAGQDLVLRWFERLGMSPGDVQWVYLANGESKAALGAGSIDAWSTWGSYVGIAVLENHDRVLADATPLPRSVGFYAAADNAIANKKTMLADYVQRLTRARAWARDHPRDYAAVLAEETKIPFAVALFTVQSYLGAAIPIDDGVIEEQVQIFARYRRAGIISKVPDLRGGYDAEFNGAVAAAVRQGRPAG